MALTVYFNTGSSDLPLLASGAEFTEVDLDNDVFLLSAGSDTVKDGEPIPSSTQLTQAGLVLITPRVDQTVPHYFLADNNANELKEIFNMGAGNYRYVVAFDFDDVSGTASEPQLQLFDDTDLDSVDNVSLGAGTPSASWWRGICTTSGLPGIGWTGSRLAGSSDGYYLNLNDESGPLTEADTLYCQLKVVIPSTTLTSGSSGIVIAVKHS